PLGSALDEVRAARIAEARSTLMRLAVVVRELDDRVFGDAEPLEAVDLHGPHEARVTTGILARRGRTALVQPVAHRREQLAVLLVRRKGVERAERRRL